MPCFRVGNRNILFLHVPKCAGSSLTQMLIEHPDCEAHGLHRPGRDGFEYAVGVCPPQHFHAAILGDILKLDRFDLVFAIVRDPLKRLLSEHAMCLRRGDSKETDFPAWYAEARRLREADAYLWDNHLRPAVEFMLPDTLVYALEGGLHGIWADLCGRLDIDGDISAVKHIRPRQSVATGEASVSAVTREHIRKDYAADYGLHRFAWERHEQGHPVATFADWQHGESTGAL